MIEVPVLLPGYRIRLTGLHYGIIRASVESGERSVAAKAMADKSGERGERVESDPPPLKLWRIKAESGLRE